MSGLDDRGRGRRVPVGDGPTVAATPASTVEAMLFCVRSGLSGLQDPATLERLSRCDADVIRQIAIRLRTWKLKNVAWLPAYTDNDIATLLKTWRALREGTA